MNQEQNKQFLSAIKSLNCPKHQEPYVLVCIQNQCKADDRLFCLQCNDQSQLEKKTHQLISVKKFESMYTKYNKVLKNDQRVKVAQKIKKIRQIIELNLVELQKMAIVQDHADLNIVQGEEEQIVKGKISNILNTKVWSDILDLQNKKSSEQEILKYVKTCALQRNQTSSMVLEKLQLSIVEVFQKSLNSLNFQINLPKQKFSATRKHKDIKISQDCCTVANTSQYGHYFALTELDFDVDNSSYKFKVGPINEETTYWLGFTFPTLSEPTKWTNIYDAKKGTYAIAIYDNGRQINFWSNERVQKQTLKSVPIKTNNFIELKIVFETKTLVFNLLKQGKSTLIKSIKPQKWFGKIYPVVGFYGNQGHISVA